MPKINLRFHIVTPEVVGVTFYPNEERRSVNGKKLPDDWQAALHGWTDKIFFYDEAGVPVKSWHQIVNELSVNLDEAIKSPQRASAEKRRYVLQDVFWNDPKYGMIKLRGVVVDYIVKITAQEAESVGQAVTNQLAQKILSGQLLALSPSGGNAVPLQSNVSPAVSNAIPVP